MWLFTCASRISYLGKEPSNSFSNSASTPIMVHSTTKYNPKTQGVWPVPLAQVLPRPQLIFFFRNLVLGNLFEFSAAEIT
jgi:hypothetical protein